MSSVSWGVEIEGNDLVGWGRGTGVFPGHQGLGGAIRENWIAAQDLDVRNRSVSKHPGIQANHAADSCASEDWGIIGFLAANDPAPGMLHGLGSRRGN